MPDFIHKLFSSDGFMPHGHCYLWTPGVVRLHVASDVLIALAYFSIPISLGWFVRQRRDIDFRWIFVCFATFILACGTTHAMEVWNVWHGNYWLAGAVKAVTAAASIPTAILLTRLLPQAVALPSPAALTRANSALDEEVQMRRVAQESLHELNAELEKRVENRTAELHGANLRLQAEIAERRRAEEALRTSEDRYRTLFEYAPEGILVADADGHYLDANASICHLLGYTRDELLKLEAQDIVAESEIPAIAAARQAVKEKSEHQWGWKFRRKDGSTFEAEVIATEMPDGNRLGLVRDVTERQRAAAALRESDERLRLITNLVPHGIFAKDGAGRYIFANRALADGCGRAVADVLGKTDLELASDPAQAATYREDDLIVLRKDEPHFIPEERFTDAAGHTRVLQTTKIPFTVPATGERAVMGVSVDITERKRAEEALRESEEQFRTMVDAIAQLAWMAEPDGFIFWYNQRWFDFTGTTPEQMEGWGWQRVHDPDLLPEVTARWKASIASAVPFEMTFPLRAASGEYRWFLTRAFPLKDAAGQVVRWCGTNTDVSRMREAEKEILRLNTDLERRVVERTAQLEAANTELRHSRAELNSLFESLPGLYLVLTPELNIVSVSDAYLKATLTTREGILGRHLFDVFPDNPNDPDAHATDNLQASLDRVLQSASPDIMAIQKYDIRRPDGAFEEHYWSPINSPVLGGNREIKYIVHRVEEVTEFMRQKGQPPAAGGGELSARVQQMEAEIFQSSQKLQASNQQLEAANKELESFSYSVSHDLRAPLRAVDGFSQAVLDDYGATLPEDGRRYLQTIREGAQRMGQLIDDLLRFSRLSRAPLQRQEVDTAALVGGVLEDLRGLQAGRQIELRIGELPACAGDAALLKQVWMNLLSNAFKYTLKRAETVVEIGCQSAPGGRVFFVRDNGTGFDMRYASKLFGVFQRLHRAEEFEGTGVGLALVQRIIHRHGGRVWAEAEVERGATFFFTLEPQNKP